MRYEEALEWCDTFRDNVIKNGGQGVRFTLALQAMRKAMMAISKQIPRKVENMTCPECGRIFLMMFRQTRGTDFCDNCGQALDWEDE